MYQATFLILSALVLFISDVGFKKVKINENITVLLPENFIPMSAQDIASRHVSYRPPLAIFTNQERTVDFSVNTAVSSWPSSDLPLMKSFYKASIGSLFSEIEFLTDEIREIDKKEYAVLEFISVTEDEEGSLQSKAGLRNYTYAQYTIEEGKTYVFTFTAPARQKDKWQPIVKQTMESIRFKKSRK